MDIFQLAYIFTLLTMIAGILEFQIMRGYTGDMYYKEYYITNAKQVIQATKALFDDNQSLYIAFSYSFVFLSGIILLDLYAYWNNLMTTYAWYWSFFSIALILLHVLVPYKLTYLNFALEAMKRDVPFDWFINNNLMFFKKKKDLEKIILPKEKLTELKDSFQELNFNSYEEYKKITQELKEHRDINYLDEIKYKKFIGSFQDNEIIVKDKNGNFESAYIGRKDLSFIETDPNMKSVFFKLFVPQAFSTLLLIRITEIPMYFIVFLYLLKNHGGY